MVNFIYICVKTFNNVEWRKAMRKTIFRRTQLIAVVYMATLIFMAGCQHQPPVMNIQPSEPMETEDISMTVSPPRNRDINAVVMTEANTGSSESVADILKTRVQGNLADQGFKQNILQPDFLVNMTVSTNKYDTFGEFFIYSSSVKVNVLGPPALNTLAKKSFSAKGERKLGRGAALSNVAAKIAKPIENWLRSVLTPDRLRALTSDITVKIPDHYDQTPSAYATEMTGIISNMAGVRKCEVISNQNQTVVFRVDYDQDAFSEGLGTFLKANTQPTNQKLSRSVITITVPKKYKTSQPKYTVIFTQKLNDLPGIKSCRVKSQNASGLTTYEVIYYPESFPEGLYNRIVVIPELDLLDD